MDKTLTENRFAPMPEETESRFAQIPITKERFEYLTDRYSPQENDRWILFHHPGHFVIYDNSTGYCIYDAEYAMLRDPKKENDKEELVAFIPEFITNRNTVQFPAEIKDYFIFLADLISKDL